MSGYRWARPRAGRLLHMVHEAAWTREPWIAQPRDAAECGLVSEWRTVHPVPGQPDPRCRRCDRFAQTKDGES